MSLIFKLQKLTELFRPPPAPLPIAPRPSSSMSDKSPTTDKELPAPAVSADAAQISNLKYEQESATTNLRLREIQPAPPDLSTQLCSLPTLAKREEYADTLQQC